MVVHVSDYIYWVEAVSLTGGKMLLAWIMREITHDEDWDADSLLKQLLALQELASCNVKNHLNVATW